ncbi:MAG: UbiA family prenyltransferase [Chloroflexi bacterium]|nr:UbiA family prenyltransferase [Chloroflexota bacterium]
MASSTRLGMAMLAIQVAIGATNDLADLDADRRSKPWKPLVTGGVTRPIAIIVAGVGITGGILIAASASAAAAAVAALGAAIGVAYDLRLKGTVLSWLPFALGVPLIPVFAWIGTTGWIPIPVAIAAGIAVPAGAAIAVANALPDIEGDERSGVRTVATVLGRERAWRLDAAFQVGVVVVAIVALAVVAGARLAPPVWLAVAGSVALLAAGVGLSGDRRRGRRQRGWELQAVATGLLGAAWLGGLAAAGRL